MQKSNAIRMLEKNNIIFEIVEYEVDEDLRGIHTADKLHLSYDIMFKTLLVQDDKNNYFVCVIPVNEELDLKKSARSMHVKSITMVPMKNLLSICGYVRGACSPIGMKKKFPTYIDETCLLFDEIYVSGGKRGLMIKINSNDLIKVTEAICTDLVI